MNRTMNARLLDGFTYPYGNQLNMTSARYVSTS
jgi:hypothetical protein